MGCGYDPNLRGKGTAKLVSGETLDTCPQWLSRQPSVAGVFEFYQDYSKGRLGNVLKLPSVLLQCLRAAESEIASWDSAQQEKLYG